MERLWDIDENFVDEHALTVAVSRVRNKIETNGQQYICLLYTSMLWSETSYRGPLVPAGNKRYQELFQKIMPKEAVFL